jgi:2-oxoisovalerate dehydrogenase E2 component (dihydrolipoyl transacylase)
MTELKQFKLPDVGEGLTEADIVKWHVQPGDRVTINQVIVEIETAKAVVELPSPFEGVVADLLAAEGATVDVGTPILSVSTGEGADESAPAVAAPAEAAAPGTAAPPTEAAAAAGAAAPAGAGAPPEAAEITAPRPAAEQAEASADPRTDAAALPAADAVAGTQESAPREERQAVLVGYGVKLGRTTRRQRKPTAAGPAASAAPGATAAAPSGTAVPAGTAAPAEAAAPAAGPAGTTAPRATPAAIPPNGESRAEGSASARALAKPPVRKLARDLGVDLGALTGSGPQGSITRDDVQQAVGRHPAAGPAGAGQAAAGMAAVTAVPREERIAIRGVRKHTAAAVTASAFTAPHVTEFLQLDVTGSTEALARLRELPEFAGLRVSPLLLAARALIVAVARHPMINSSWDEEAREIVVHHYVNLGIAAATERGLVVPNVKDAHALSLPELARALGQLTETARAGKTTPADLAHGTITITNVGVFGVDAGTPILTPGEAAILALGQIKDAPWVHEGELAVRKVTTLALSFDHRIVDGDLGSTVLSDVGAMLADPLRLLAWG